MKALLDTIITSAAHAQTLGIALPYPQFVDPAIQTTRTVAQALRPFPQYGNIRLSVGGGDKTGSSHYHAVVFKLNQRMHNGLALQSSYTWSRIMTDSDNFGSGSSLDTARPELEWSIGANDQTHNIKINTVYELPFGTGRRWLTRGDRERGAGRLASGADAELRERRAAGGHREQRADDLQYSQPSGRDGSAVESRDRRGRVRSEGGSVLQQGGVRHAGRRARQCPA